MLGHSTVWQPIMTTKPFGTPALARDLEAAGVANGQAQAIAAGIRDARADLVTKADLDVGLAALESRQEAKLANAVNRMLLGNIAIAGLLFAALKLFS